MWRCFSLAAHQILPLSSRQWTISTKPLPPHLIAIPFLSPSAQLLLLVRTPLIGITTRQINQKLIASQWVGTNHIQVFIILIPSSSSPLTQAQILQSTRLGRFVGRHCPQHRPQGVQSLVCPCMLQYWQWRRLHCCGFCRLSTCIMFLWGSLMTSYSINSLKHLPITFLTICWSLPQFCLSSVTNSIYIFPPTWRMSRMAFCGGMRDVRPSLACLAWLGTTLNSW